MLKSQILVVGDVHGCFNTFRELVQQHWHPKEEVLIQIGDVIDRGNYSPECVTMLRTMQVRFPGKVIVLKGNHEFEAVLYHEKRSNPGWLRQGGSETLAQYKQRKQSILDDIPWAKKLPLYVDTPGALITHAGVTETKEPFKETNPRGVLWNRTTLRNIGKLQIIGHTPVKSKPEYRMLENVWNIDTGAYRGEFLSAIRLSREGKVLDTVSIPAFKGDYTPDS